MVLLLPTDEGYVAYDLNSDRLHNLNPLAALIVELCDGTRTARDITELVESLLPPGAPLEVDHFIAQGIESGLLQSSGTPVAPASEIPLEELRQIAARLAESGRLQVAFLCWKWITQRKPDDARAWYALGEVARWLGRPDHARTAYTKYLQQCPEDAEIQHFVVALGEGAPPSRVPNACVQQIYRRLAPLYDAHMREQLNYQAPERLHDAIKTVVGDRREMEVLDLGCGSGLSGAFLKEWASRLTGVDLSAEMIELARKRNIYDQLDTVEITDWLDRCKAQFDLIVACECLVYFGDLHKVISSSALKLNSGGVVGLTVEHGDRFPFHLTSSGRYAHHNDHLREVSKKAGLTVAHLQDGFLRMEYGTPVAGLYVVLSKEN